MRGEPKPPGVWAWVLIGAVLAIGLLGFLVVFVGEIMAGRANYQTIAVPGRIELELPRAGDYTIFHEYDRTTDSLGLQKPVGLTKLQCTLHDAASNERITLTAAGNDARYAIRRTVGESLFQFHIARPGKYIFSAAYPQDEEGDAGRFAIKQSYRTQVFAAFAKGIAVLLATTLLIAVIFWRAGRRGAGDSGPSPAL